MIRTLMASAALGGLILSGPATAQVNLDSGPAPQRSADNRFPVGGIFGCSADGNKQGLAAVIGGAAGALLGNGIAGRGSRTLGTLLGGAVGAAAGSAIGCKLQKDDRDRAERATQDALDTGESQSWNNAQTGASGQVTVADGAGGAALGNLRFAPGVEPAGSFSRVGDSFTTSGNTNVRGGPSTSAIVLGTLPAGRRVWVPAQVSGQSWYLIAEDGVAQGYVYAPLLGRASSVAAADCKMVTQSVNVPGEAAQSETYQACKGADGTWTMTRA